MIDTPNSLRHLTRRFVAAPAPGARPSRMLVSVMLTIGTAGAAPGPGDPPLPRPNVVLVMADDLGFGDLGCYGHATIRTPVLDKLAREGIRLTDFHAGATVCTPSRMALMTGAYPARLGWTQGVVGHLMEEGTGLNPEALTVAEVFRDAGYATGLVGKWHLGDAPECLPGAQGFDEAFYITRSNNQVKELWRDGVLVEKRFDNRRLTETFAREAVRFIDRHHGQPFFLYVPFTAPHFPVEAHPDWDGRSEFGPFGDVVEEMDHRIGEMLSSLDGHGIADRTLVVFLSDNGPEPGTRVSSAGPFRGRKWSALEGGTRVPCIARWPGVIPPGRTSDTLVAAIDVMPTLCRAAGIDLTKFTSAGPPIDGIDVWKILTGEHRGKPPREELLYWHGRDGFQAIRVGEWKLFPGGRGAGLEGVEGRPVLFNVLEDPEERRDRSAEFPETVEALAREADERLAEIEAHGLPLHR